MRMPCAPSAARQRREDRTAERQLRAGLLELSAGLGWDAPTAARFAEAVTGRPWRACRRADLRRVLEAYAALAQRMRAVHDRQTEAAGPDRRMP